MTDDEMERYRLRVAAALDRCGCDQDLFLSDGPCDSCTRIVDLYMKTTAEHEAKRSTPQSKSR